MTLLKQRAMSAYFRSHDGIRSLQYPSEPEVVVINDKKYIVLSDIQGIIAVYRVRFVNGKEVLKRLVRYPKELQ